MNTKLVNYRTHNFDKSKIIPIDRRSPFGNPFIIGRDGTRKDVIIKYKKYFYKKLEDNCIFKMAVEKLKGKTLGCWCVPKSCHGDVIIEYLENL